MNALNTILLVISIVSLICVLIMSPVAIADYFGGTENVKKLLKHLRIPLSDKTVAIIWFISVGMLLLSYFLRKILFQ